MSKKNIGTSNDEPLLDLFNQMDNDLLVLKPTFQRNLVWTDKHKENFIDTILRGYPFPEIYLCEGEVDIDSKKITRWVVDGQQRLHTIYAYIKGKLECKKIKSFEELAEQEKKDFYNYKIVVRNLGDIDDDEIREIFRRINSVQYALNAMEIRNALYEGEYIGVAQSIAESKKLEGLSIFTKSQYSRMKNAEFILLVMSTVEINGYFTRDREVEGLVKRFDNYYSDKKKMKQDILGTLEAIDKLKLPLDSIWFKKSSFFTLLVELVKHKREKRELPKLTSLKKVLVNLEKKINNSKSGDIDRNQYARYYYYIYQATASKSGRIARAEVLKKHLESID